MSNTTLQETKSLLKGVVNIQFTPLKSMTEIDEEALRENTRFMIENGIVEGRGVQVIGGSNGEGFSLTTGEYKRLIDVVLDEANGRVPICVGCIRPAARTVIEVAQYAEKAGADCIMVLPPHYYPAPIEAVYAHFKAIADATDIPIMVYNNTCVTGQDLPLEAIRQLAEIDQIVAIKECTPRLYKFREVALHFADRFALLPCYTQWTMPFDYQLGAVGFITLFGNFNPAYPLEVHEACLANDFERAQEIYARSRPLFAYVDRAVEAGGPARETALVKEMARIAGRPLGEIERPPIMRPSEEERRELQRLMTETGLL